jgi:adenylate cyclase
VPALATLSFRPLLVLWSGIAVALAWGMGTWLIATAPGAVVGLGDLPPASAGPASLARYLLPSYVHTDDAVVRVFVMLVLVAILAYGAARARGLIYEPAMAARERANLARYVAPQMVESLARADNPLAGDP